MAATSTMLPLGTPLPEFTLVNAADGRSVSTAALKGPAILVMFICNHCPYVVHVRDELTRLCGEYLKKGVVVVAVNSNSGISHPEDGPEHMRALARELGWKFPFVFDESQDVARAFRAACTPEFYVFDRERRLTYRGRLDDSRPQSGTPVTGRDLRAALDATLAGAAPSSDQKPSTGCSIKWHPAK